MRREPAFDDLDFDEPESAVRPTGGKRMAGRVALAAAAIAMLTLFAREKSRHETPPQGWTEPARSQRASSARAAIPASTAGPLLAMETADPLGRQEPPRWNAGSGLREDALTQGAFDAIEAPFFRLIMTETGPTAEPATSLFVTLARRAADMQGLSVIRTGIRGTIDTKFGPFETVEATLSGRGARHCTAFAGIGRKAMRIEGWLCGVLGQAPEPRALACAIDAVRLAIAAPPTIEIVFGEAELRRGAGCGASASGPRVDETGSIAGRKSATGEDNPRRPRKNAAKLRRNAEAGL